MPDRRVPRPGGRAVTPGGEDTDHPLNDGGVVDYREEEKERQKALEDYIEKNTPKTSGAPSVGGGGFGVKPMTDVLSQTNQRGVSEMSGADKFLIMSYQDVLEYITGENELEELIQFIRQNDEYVFNPPTRDEFGQMLKFAISRKEGKIKPQDVPSADARAANRELASPSAKKEYADPINKAFPIDSPTRIQSAHAYIHKYWNEPSKRGVTASYGRNDFITAHKKIVAAMQKNDIEHNYLDSLDDASGFSKPKSKEIKASQNSSCVKCQQAPCCCAIESPAVESKGVGLFNFKVGQQVVSFARGGIKAPGEIIKIDGAIANVQWASGLITTELLVGLVPNI